MEIRDTISASLFTERQYDKTCKANRFRSDSNTRLKDYERHRSTGNKHIFISVINFANTAFGFPVLRVSASSFDWTMDCYASFVIGHSNYFGFGFTTLNCKLL